MLEWDLSRTVTNNKWRGHHYCPFIISIWSLLGIVVGRWQQKCGNIGTARMRIPGPVLRCTAACWRLTQAFQGSRSGAGQQIGRRIGPRWNWWGTEQSAPGGSGQSPSWDTRPPQGCWRRCPRAVHRLWWGPPTNRTRPLPRRWSCQLFCSERAQGPATERSTCSQTTPWLQPRRANETKLDGRRFCVSCCPGQHARDHPTFGQLLHASNAEVCYPNFIYDTCLFDLIMVLVVLPRSFKEDSWQPMVNWPLSMDYNEEGTQQPLDTFLVVDSRPFRGKTKWTSWRRACSGHFKHSQLITSHLGGKPNGLFLGEQAANLGGKTNELLKGWGMQRPL